MRKYVIMNIPVSFYLVSYVTLIHLLQIKKSTLNKIIYLHKNPRPRYK